MAFSIKQGDTAPAYVAQLVDVTASTPLDLTTATQVLFKMRKANSSGNPKVSAACSLLNPLTDGKVQHNWGATDTDANGTFSVEFEITWQDGTVETVPNDSYLTVNVVEDLDH